MFFRFALRAALGAAVALGAALGTARADMVYIGDKDLPGQFTGTVEVFDQTKGSATIRVTLTNVSPQSNGGFITGLAFNDPAPLGQADITGVSSFATSYTPATNQNFQLLGGPSFDSGILTSPYGRFDIGAAVGGAWTGTGKARDGLAVGETGTFTFNVTGTGLSTLTAAGLLSALSSNGESAGFAVRFRGFKDGSSDKDLAGVVTPPPPPPQNPIPAPPGLVLACVGFGSLFLGRLRRRAI